jgi:hypothetical protein
MKIAIFYHVYQYFIHEESKWSDWEQIYIDQMQDLKNSGLYEAASYIHIGINWNKESKPLPDVGMNITSIKYNRNYVLEAETLVSLWDFCNAEMGNETIPPQEWKVLYLNNSGVSHCRKNHLRPKVYGKNRRNLFNICYVLNWRDCVNKLDTHDCVGINWCPEFDSDGKRTPAHYSGNWWWANSKCITKLDPSFLYQYNDRKGVKSEYPLRNQCEFWLGTKDQNYYCFREVLNTI